MTDQRLKLQTALCSPNQVASGQPILSRGWKIVQIVQVDLLSVLINVVNLLSVLKNQVDDAWRCKSNLGLLATKPVGLLQSNFQEAQVGLAPPGVVDLGFKHAE